MATAMVSTEFLVKRDRKVTIVDMAEKPGEGLVEITKRRLFAWLAKKGWI